MAAVNSAPSIQPWLLVLAAGLNSCIGNLLLKKSRLAAETPGLVPLLLSPWFISGLFFYAVNVVLFAKALDKLPVSTAYPALAATGFALLVMSAAMIYGERIGLNQVIGLAAVLIGIWFLARD